MVISAVMKDTLALLFKSYRPILPVVAHRNLRMRGQAFVTFNDVEQANRARLEVAEFPLYGKALVRFFSSVSHPLSHIVYFHPLCSSQASIVG